MLFAIIFFLSLLTIGKQKPMPKHNLFLGHLLAIKPYIDRLPKDAHGFIPFGKMAQEYSGGIFYLDMWPFIGPIMICTSASAAIQATQKSVLQLRKPASLDPWFHSIAGGPNLFTMPVDEWRTWRNIFNPGFSQAHLNSLVPRIVEEVKSYRKLLQSFADRNEMFLLDEETLWFTMDLIGALVLEARLDSKRTSNPLATSLLSQLRWKLSQQELNPFIRWNPIRPLVERYNSWQMNSYIGKELDKRYDAYHSALTNSKPATSKSVISLVIEGYTNSQTSSETIPQAIDPTFKAYATSQIRTFLFAGHDTTSSTICHIYYLLSKNPFSRRKLIQELDDVLGSNVQQGSDILSGDPHLLNKLSYTTAIIKESMRLFPPASGIREGVEGVSIADDNGRLYPTGKIMVWILHQAIQRDPKYWKNPTEFIPERWTVGPEDPLYPVKGAWRPFEHGPRNCIGQGLVMMELKIILALTVREFDVKDAYDEFDKLYPRNSLKTVDGERAYQVEHGGAHPADRFPCRVSRIV
jgi:cytochrome P450